MKWRNLIICLISLAAIVEKASAAEVARIPFVYQHNAIFVRVKVDGKGPYNFIIDTDTTPSALNLDLARELKVPLGRAGWGTGVGSGKTAAYPLRIPLVALGLETATNMDALAVYLTDLGTYAGLRIDGVLGTSFLNGRVLQIDYPCRTVTFLAEPLAVPPTARFRWNEYGGNTMDDVWVGPIKVSATFDSADGGFGTVPARGIADLHVETEARSGPSAVARGYLGQERATSGSIDNVRIGSADLGKLQVRFLPDSRFSWDLNIGNRAVDQYIVTMDYIHGTFTLSKSGPCPPLAQ